MAKLSSMRWVGHAYRILMGKPEGNIPLERPRRMKVNNVKMDVREIRWG
jgi:hypothetical protein